MKRIISTTLFLAITLLTISGQPGAVKKAANAVFTLTTYRADGTQLSQTNGFFINADGTAVSCWTPFNGAARAEITDANGQHHHVSAIYGADELYNIAKFQIDGKVPAALTTSSQHPANGSQVFVINRNLKPQATTIAGVENFLTKYAYYILSDHNSSDIDGAPVVNAAGQVIGLARLSTTGTVNAVDARYTEEFKLNGLSANDNLLRNTGIRIALPNDQQQAQIALIMASNYERDKYEATINDFIAKFPTLNDGYYARATLEMTKGNGAAADEALQTAIKKASPKDEGHFNYARVIYQSLTMSDSLLSRPASWTIDNAAAQAEEANHINPQPAYDHLLAQITYLKGNYQKAYDDFMALTKTSFRNPELYYEAAQSKTMLKATDEEILALLDSAIAVCDTPYVATSAPYFLARAAQYDKMGNYRKAMLDYYTYEYFNQGMLTADFYYIREQCEMRGKLYQQALQDIFIALRLNPEEPTYFAELANVCLRIGKPENAIEPAQEAIKLSPDFADAYLVLGIAQCQTGKKTEGKQNLEKAKSLGNTQADSFIIKYK